MKTFSRKQLSSLYKPIHRIGNKDNGQVTIVGGSKLFHGAPLLSLKVASRIVDMVFFATPTPSVGRVAERIKSKLLSYIWVPWEEVDAYIEKSDAVLIGPGLMRYRKEGQKLETLDQAGKLTYDVTKRFLTKFPNKRWVIDAGSLQVIDPEFLPKDCVVTPNEKEYRLLFNDLEPSAAAEKYKCIINSKGSVNIVCSSTECVEIPGGNAGLTKGGVGDVLAGLTVALLAKNKPFLAACAASFICKAAADELYKKVGTNYNADDLADKIPETLHNLQT